MAQGGAVGLDCGGEDTSITLIIERLKGIDQRELQQIFNDLGTKKSLTIVVSGRTGVGKSTLISSILPGVLTKAQAGPTSTKHDTLEEYNGEILGVKVTIYDTCGFSSLKMSDAPSLHEKLEDICRHGENIDLFIFCQAMYDRFDTASLEALQTFGSMLEKRAWAFCVIALTKANMSPLSLVDATDNKAEMSELTKAIKKDMQDLYFSPQGLLDISNNIPFVPVGCKAKGIDLSTIPGSSDDSIEDLIVQCVSRCKPHSVGALITAVSKKPFIQFEAVDDCVGVSIGATGGVVTGTIIGAGIGAGIGAVSIPGIGLVPGAIVGAIVGFGGGLTVGASIYPSVKIFEAVMKRAWERYQEKKSEKQRKKLWQDAKKID